MGHSSGRPTDDFFWPRREVGREPAQGETPVASESTYCVGCKSFPGDVIARGHNLDREIKLAERTPDAFEGSLVYKGADHGQRQLSKQHSTTYSPNYLGV
jgi:hypothetical protein